MSGAQPELYYRDNLVTVYHGDAFDVLPRLPAASVDAVVTDPPYGIEFMRTLWDTAAAALYDFSRGWATLAARALKPGGWLLAFGSPRTVHRMVCGIEDAGFEIRDGIDWLYGSGFPKSVDVARAVGDERWQGWGTALKPAREPIMVARKPLAGTVAANVRSYGTGAVNIDATRVPTTSTSRTSGDPGRWPTNVVMSHAGDDVVGDLCADGCVPGCPVAVLDQQSGLLSSGANPTRRAADRSRDVYGAFGGQAVCNPSRGADCGGASRFFPVFRYQAKASAAERPRVDGVSHPTVKPLGLMRWLVRLVAPAGGLLLDPFAGSGTTAQACAVEGVRCIAVERAAEYLPLIRARLAGPTGSVLPWEVTR